MGEVIQIQDLKEFNDFKASHKFVAVDFTATWCGPCRMISPEFEALSKKYTDVAFVKVDVDEAQDICKECEIQCMPTFHFYKNGKKMDHFSGANKDKLREFIEKWLGEDTD